MLSCRKQLVLLEMNHLRTSCLLSLFLLGNTISPFALSSELEMEPGSYHYSAEDLREVSENLACLQIKNSLAANPAIVPISKVQENCLHTLVDAAPHCSDIWEWKDSQPCQISQQFMIKNSSSARWTSCFFEKEIKRYKNGGTSSRDTLKCGRNFYSGAPSIEQIALKSSQTPGLSYHYLSEFRVTNPKGETERYLPFHAYIKKIVVSTKPVAKKVNLTTKYYFPVEIVVLAKYHRDQLSLYVKRN